VVRPITYRFITRTGEVDWETIASKISSLCVPVATNAYIGMLAYRRETPVRGLALKKLRASIAMRLAVNCWHWRSKMPASPKLITPKNGEHVASTQHEGVFEVVFVNSLMQTANIRLVDGSGHVVPNVPWTALTALNKK
jgi:hypothetical protein